MWSSIRDPVWGGVTGSFVLLLFLLSAFVYLETFLNKEPNNHLLKIKVSLKKQNQTLL